MWPCGLHLSKNTKLGEGTATVGRNLWRSVGVKLCTNGAKNWWVIYCPTDLTDRHRCHAGCLSNTQIAPSARQIARIFRRQNVPRKEIASVEIGEICGRKTKRTMRLKRHEGEVAHRSHRSTQIDTDAIRGGHKHRSRRRRGRWAQIFRMRRVVYIRRVYGTSRRDRSS